MIRIFAKFHIPASNISLVLAIKLKSKLKYSHGNHFALKFTEKLPQLLLLVFRIFIAIHTFKNLHRMALLLFPAQKFARPPRFYYLLQVN
jgi:hypothetical protein